MLFDAVKPADLMFLPNALLGKRSARFPKDDAYDQRHQRRRHHHQQCRVSPNEATIDVYMCGSGSSNQPSPSMTRITMFEPDATRADDTDVGLRSMIWTGLSQASRWRTHVVDASRRRHCREAL